VRKLGTILFLLLFVGRLSVDIALSAERIWPIRIGALADSQGTLPQVEGLRDGLLKLGYREREQFIIDVRFTQEHMAGLPAAARKLVQEGVDIIFAEGASAAKAAQRATSQIPIVFASVGDPLDLGLVWSFARPGDNITGVTDQQLKLSEKRLEIYRMIIPGLKRVLFLYHETDACGMRPLERYRDGARYLEIVLVEKGVRSEEEVQSTLAQVQKGEVDGILAPPSTSLNIPGFILEAAAQSAIPTMFHGALWVERGGLAGYGPDGHASGRQAARLVDKILKGTSPGEIPVEVNSNIEFAINLKTAKALGLTIPPEVLFQATKVIR
jgi:putative ABC transport system substrate-binding protein